MNGWENRAFVDEQSEYIWMTDLENGKKKLGGSRCRWGKY
jgi:hypothetical protein